MQRRSPVVRFLALGVAAVLAACACEDNPEAGEYCEEITGPQAAALSAPNTAVVAPELAALLEASLQSTAREVTGSAS